MYGKVTSGAEDDLDQVTRIARQMVGRWGMSSAVGVMSVLPAGTGESPHLPDSNGSFVSEATPELVDQEVRRIVAECHDAAVTRLRENGDRLDALPAALLELESLDEGAAYRAAGFVDGAGPNGAETLVGAGQATAFPQLTWTKKYNVNASHCLTGVRNLT